MKNVSLPETTLLQVTEGAKNIIKTCIEPFSVRPCPVFLLAQGGIALLGLLVVGWACVIRFGQGTVSSCDATPKQKYLIAGMRPFGILFLLSDQ